MTDHAIGHLWLLASVLTFGLFVAWVTWHLCDDSPHDVAQQELDKKRRRP